MRRRMYIVGGLALALVLGCGSLISQVFGRDAAPAPSQAISHVTTPSVLSDELRPSPSQPTYRESLSGVTMAYETVLANLDQANEPGYKALRPLFKAGSPMPELRRDYSPGWPVATGRWLDVAINGPGYFAIEADPWVPGARAYCRVGRFYISRDHKLVLGSPDGPRVTPYVVFPDRYREIVIDREGRVLVTMEDNASPVEVGQIELVRFAHDGGLELSGQDLFHTTAESGAPIQGVPGEVGFGYLKQKHLEGSNVDVVAELAELRQLKRWGQTLSDALQIETIFDTQDLPVSISLASPHRQTLRHAEP